MNGLGFGVRVVRYMVVDEMRFLRYENVLMSCMMVMWKWDQRLSYWSWSTKGLYA